MLRTNKTLLGIFILSTACLTACGIKVEPADIVFTGGTVRTMDSNGSIVESIAVRADKIVYVGDETGAVEFIDTETEIVDIEDGVLFPGFTDGHSHPGDAGRAILSLSFSGKDNAQDILRKTDLYSRNNPELEVIVGIGWSLTMFENGNPHKSLLDSIIADKPVVLYDSNYHSIWANSAALTMAGIDRNTQDPLNGIVEHDPVSGEPSGTLRETAMNLMSQHLPTPSVEDEARYLRAGLQHLSALGYTAVVGAAVETENREAAYAALVSDDLLKVRAQLALSQFTQTPLQKLSDISARLESLRVRRDRVKAQSGNKVSANMVKIFLDGGLESCSAAFKHIYSDSWCGGSQSGYLNMPEIVLNEYVTALDALGFQVHFHSIGDKATQAALDAVAIATQENKSRDRRHTISHLQFVHNDDLPRFRELGVYANIQALWAYPYDHSMDPFRESDIGGGIYPFRSFRDNGAQLVYGSDWPISSANPFSAVEVAVSRRDFSDATGDTLLAEQQAISVDDMMKALTTNGARLMHQEKYRGSIEVGKVADLVLVDRDPYNVPISEISETKVLLTLFNGKYSHRSPNHAIRSETSETQ